MVPGRLATVDVYDGGAGPTHCGMPQLIPGKAGMEPADCRVLLEHLKCLTKKSSR